MLSLHLSCSYVLIINQSFLQLFFQFIFKVDQSYKFLLYDFVALFHLRQTIFPVMSIFLLLFDLIFELLYYIPQSFPLLLLLHPLHSNFIQFPPKFLLLPLQFREIDPQFLNNKLIAISLLGKSLELVFFFDELLIFKLYFLSLQFILVAEGGVGFIENSKLILQTFDLLLDNFIILLHLLAVKCGLFNLLFYVLYLIVVDCLLVSDCCLLFYLL